MRFISPTTDFAFKRIFGSTESREILISFLNSLIYAGRKEIEDLEILDPYSGGRVVYLKDSFLDVKAVLSNKKTVIIEMQLVNLGAFEKRVLYNLAKTYVNQLQTGAGYKNLQPVIALTITNFQMFDESEAIINHFVFQETQEKYEYKYRELEMVFVELPKFNKSLEELTNITDKWLYFLKNTSDLEIVPDSISEVSEIRQALNIAERANLQPEELDEVQNRELFIESYEGAIVRAKEEAREEALKEGEQKGLEEGLKKGQAQLILRLLSRRFGTIAPELSSSIESLSSEQLSFLGEAIFELDSLEKVAEFLPNNSYSSPQ